MPYSVVCVYIEFCIQSIRFVPVMSGEGADFFFVKMGSKQEIRVLIVCWYCSNTLEVWKLNDFNILKWSKVSQRSECSLIFKAWIHKLPFRLILFLRRMYIITFLSPIVISCVTKINERKTQDSHTCNISMLEMICRLTVILSWCSRLFLHCCFPLQPSWVWLVLNCIPSFSH